MTARICPHNGVLAIAFLGDIDGKPAVLYWGLQGPGLSVERCLEILTEMTEQLDAEAKVLNSGPVQ